MRRDQENTRSPKRWFWSMSEVLGTFPLSEGRHVVTYQRRELEVRF